MSDKLVKTETDIDSESESSVDIIGASTQASVECCTTCGHTLKKHGLWNGWFCQPGCSCLGFATPGVPQTVSFFPAGVEETFFDDFYGFPTKTKGTL